MNVQPWLVIAPVLLLVSACDSAPHSTLDAGPQSPGESDAGVTVRDPDGTDAGPPTREDVRAEFQAAVAGVLSDD